MKIQKKSPVWWVFSTYFTEGFPYMMTRVISFVFFTDMGVREAWLGFLNFLGLPWNLKFLWSPFVDLFSTKKNWMVKIQGTITLCLLAITVLTGFTKHPSVLWAIVFILIGMAFVSSTNDVAIDAYYMEGLPDKKDQAAYTGYRTMAYRVAVVFSRVVLVGIAGVANWTWGFGVGTVAMFAAFLFHRFYLPTFENLAEQSKVPPGWNKFLEAFRTYLRQAKIGLVLPFIITYKLGDEILFSMNTPFLMRELLVTKTQLAWLTGMVGAASTIAGAMLSAWWIKKVGLKKAIWPLTLMMNLNIWAYVGLAHFKPLATTQTGIAFIALVHGYEQWAAGLGGAVLTVFLMRLCKVEFKAAHYAIGSAIMSIGATFVGGFGGILVEAIGYTSLFILSFIASIPSMVLLFWIPLQEET